MDCARSGRMVGKQVLDEMGARYDRRAPTLNRFLYTFRVCERQPIGLVRLFCR
jgi:hypothetical protein